MSDEFVIIPSRESDYREIADLSRTNRSGKIFRKHILNRGPLLHPNTGKTIMVDDEFISTLKKNFDDKICDIVQVPLANDRNEHTEDPSRNIGEVVDLQEEGDKIYAIIDVRDADAAGKLGKTLLGASAMLHLNYTDTKSGKKVGPTLLHSCVTNRPYITDLDEYEEIVSATNSADNSNGAVLTAPEDTDVKIEWDKIEHSVLDVKDGPKMSEESFWTRFKTELASVLGTKVSTDPEFVKELEEKVAEELGITDKAEEAETEETLKEDDTKENEMAELSMEELISQLAEHGIDVAALQAASEGAKETEKKLEEATALSNTLSEDVETAKKKTDEAEELAKKLSDELAGTGLVTLTGDGDLSPEDVIGAVSELAQGHLALTNQVKELREKDAEREVDLLVAEGKIIPAQKEVVMVELKLSNPSMFDRLVPEKPLVEMDKEVGTEPNKGEKHENDVDAAIAAFTAQDGPLGKIAKIRK